MAFMLLFTCDLVFVVCSFPALMGNNFYLPVDILVCLETFGVITLENTNSSAKFKNFTLFTGSTFFSSLLLVLKNCLCYVNAISPTEIKIPIKIIVCFSLNENPILQTQHQLLKVWVLTWKRNERLPCITCRGKPASVPCVVAYLCFPMTLTEITRCLKLYSLSIWWSLPLYRNQCWQFCRSFCLVDKGPGGITITSGIALPVVYWFNPACVVLSEGSQGEPGNWEVAQFTL